VTALRLVAPCGHTVRGVDAMKHATLCVSRKCRKCGSLWHAVIAPISHNAARSIHRVEWVMIGRAAVKP
jgi:hypothetical protein